MTMPFIQESEKKLRRPECIPYISEYTDCSDYTTCRGCNQCRCNGEGRWVCYKKRNTCSDDMIDMEVYVDANEDADVGNILKELAEEDRIKKSKKRPTHQAPLPEKRERVTSSPVLDFAAGDAMKELHKLIRGKRSLKEANETETSIKFHHVVDEINEDTLKNSNASGTLGVRKVKAIVKSSRRAGVFVNSTSDPLHIEYNNPTIYNNHITDNKIDTSHNTDKYDALIHEKMHDIINYTQNLKDTELSKIVVNELKKGSEIIGDPNAPVASNITFTPEKDTLTAMAYIAGNLLNKLWNLEKDVTDDSTETDNMKNQKIADLLDLFKEPLSFRQETFLKDALEYLSEAVRKNKNNKQRYSLCETIDEMKKEIVSGDATEGVKKQEKVPNKNVRELSANNALSKLTEVLGLIKKYEGVKRNLQTLKHPRDTPAVNASIEPTLRQPKDDSSSLNLFGNILEKITNLLMPNNNRMKHRIENQNIFRNTHNLEDDIKKGFNINLDEMKLTPTDKLILDYINRLKSSPCPSPNQQEENTFRYKQSDILLNLSEFFKIKSYSDLIKIVNPVTKPVTQSTPTTMKYQGIQRRTDNQTGNIDTENNKTQSVNDKLKLHLKAIVNDMIELQNAKGKNIKPGDINITEALPCIFKILNQETDFFKDPKQSTQNALLNKIKTVLEAVKKDIKSMPQNRRSMSIGARPKSAVVWERVIKNLDQSPKLNRRNLNNDQNQSYEVVKKMIDNIEANDSSTYKTIALHTNMQPDDELVFLKTLLMDTSNYANILEKIIALNREKKLPEKELNEIVDFVDTATTNLDLNAKVIKHLNKSKQNRFNILTNNNKQVLKTNLHQISDINDNFEVSESVMNRMIKYKVNEVLQKKESEGATKDMVYNLAQRILSNLERGNDRLARELYKVFIETSQQENNEPASEPVMRSRILVDKRPVKLEDPSKKQWVTEDLFLKTLESAWANALTA